MPRVLVTAFAPYDHWQENASWLALQELTKDLPDEPKVVTRLYPVDLQEVRHRLQQDLESEPDVTLHLGQAPGSSVIQLEAIGINVGSHSKNKPVELPPLVSDGPMAYRTTLPLGQWAHQLQDLGIPAKTSYHAGTYLCNATLYLAQHIAEQRGLATRSAFVHVPLDPSQVADQQHEMPSLPAFISAYAVRVLLQQILTLSASKI